MNYFSLLFSFLVLTITLLFPLRPLFAASNYATGGYGTSVIVGGNNIFIIVNMELWGDGVWDDPSLAGRWEQTLETVWNNGSPPSNVKYKCYEVQVDVIMKVSTETREGPEAQYGTPGYHQIWVPNVAVGDMANTYNQYGLYLPEKGDTDVAYGEYDSQDAQQYYEQNTSEDQRASGKGKTSAFIWDPSAIGEDAQKEATWGTLPNTLSDSVLSHEFGHLLGVDHDEAGCADNVMSPSNGKTKVRTQVYPRYFKKMLDPLELMCEWNIRTDISMDAKAMGTYFPPAIEAHNEFTLKEEEAPKGYIAADEKPSDLLYDSIESAFTCNVFTWESHPGKMRYRAEILYNFKEDLKKGGRLFLIPAIMQEPYEEIKAIGGCGRPNPSDLTMVNPINHHNILYSLTGKNMQAVPYDYHADDPVSCPAKPEEPLVEQYYNEGVVIDGATSDSQAEHFPEGDLFGAKFNYEVKILDASPLP